MLHQICKSLLLPLFIGVAAQTHEVCAQDRFTVTFQSSSRCDMRAYVYDSVDIPPHFPGGDGAMVRFINNQRRYPSEAYHAGVEGRVVCSFIVESDGAISNIEVVRSVEPTLDAEAKRVISSMPAWEAGRINDNTVPVYCILAIPFRL
ncbi:MAG: energy transducer TonB [Bacteroides sp.]|nr:energy transducer TonB [Bacteroidales bacterium]MBD5315167.1 energy transducer TonB [Bacteroides sp.]MDE6249437.1 energy transducer TonB [Paramuribaculum sp.]MDE7449190.1 energy transducer TonB [Paramuribaculum sp.]